MRETNPPPYLPQIRLYQQWLADQRGLRFDSYEALWHWSTTDLEAFWQSIWDYFDLRSPTPHRAPTGSCWCAPPPHPMRRSRHSPPAISTRPTKT